MPAITPFPDPPSREDSQNFDARADDFVDHQANVFVPEINALRLEVLGAQSAASSSASAASASAVVAQTASDAAQAFAGTSMWNAATNYTVGKLVVSPKNLGAYRSKFAGVSSVDPANDAVRWEPASVLLTDLLAAFGADLQGVGAEAGGNLVGLDDHRAGSQFASVQEFADLRDQDIDDHADGNTIPARLGNPLANFYSPALTPTASVTVDPDSAAEYLKLPGTDDPWRYARNIWTIKKSERKLFFGSGSLANTGVAQNTGTTFGGVPVLTYDLDTKTWAVEAVLPEEQIDRYVEIDGTLVVPGADGLKPWDYGSWYTRQPNGSWTEQYNIPEGAHVTDICKFNGRLYCTIGTATAGALNYYDTATGTWVRMVTTPNGRMYSLFVIGESLYAERRWGTVNNDYPYWYKVNPDGITATALDYTAEDVFPSTALSTTQNERIGKSVTVDGKLVYIGGQVFKDYGWRGVGVYIAQDSGSSLKFARMSLNSYHDASDILATSDHVYLLCNRELHAAVLADRNTVYIYRTRASTLSAESVWDVALSFRSDGLARSFEIADGHFYIGMGAEVPSSSSTDLNSVTSDCGRVYRIPVPKVALSDVQSDSTYLALSDDKLRRQTPAAMDANFTIGSLPAGVTFARASSAGYLDNAGNHAVVASGTPRFEVDLLGGARGIQIEGASSNMARRSDELTNTTRWTVRGLQPVAAAIVNGDSWFELIEDTSTGRHRMLQSISAPAGGMHTLSFDALPGAGISRITTWFNISGVVTKEIYFGLIDGESNGAGGGPLPDGVTANTYPLVGGGYRIVYTADATNITAVQIGTVRTYNSYAGDGTSRLYIRKPLFEPGTLDGSYIPTIDATATRVAEALTAAPSALTVARGTLAWCGEVHGGDPTLIQADAGSDASCIRAHISGGRVLAYCGSSAVLDLGAAPTTRFVVSMSWSLADGLFYASIDGAVKSLDLTAAVAPVALTTIRIGGRVGGAVGRQYIRSAKHWGRALPLENITARGLQ